MERLEKHRAGSPGYRIARLHRSSSAVLARRLKDLPLRWGQVPLLMGVLNQDGQTQGHISREVRVDPACAARGLAALEELGLVERRENPACRRDKLVFATDAAKPVLNRILPALDEHRQLLLKGFSPEETRQVLDYLDRMIANVEQEL